MQALLQFSRFLAVGLVNSVVGYAIILGGLRAGLGDYAANATGYAVGLMIAYVLQRRFVFAVKRARTTGEILRFLAAAGLAYGVNLGVIHTARAMGHVASPLAQAVAMASYSLTFFGLSRLLVFAAPSGASHD